MSSQNRCSRCGKVTDKISFVVPAGPPHEGCGPLCSSCSQVVRRGIDDYIRAQVAHSTIRDGAELILKGLEELYSFKRTEDMESTPERVARMYAELCSGLAEDPKDILSVTYPAADNPALVVTSRIDFISFCRHHLALILGSAYVGYLPRKHIVGLSKISRLVDCFAKRPQIQEEMTDQIADAIVQYLVPQGVVVVVSAQHGCMSTRGVLKKEATTETSAVRGVFLTNTYGCKDEFFQLIKLGEK